MEKVFSDRWMRLVEEYKTTQNVETPSEELLSSLDLLLKYGQNSSVPDTLTNELTVWVRAKTGWQTTMCEDRMLSALMFSNWLSEPAYLRED